MDLDGWMDIYIYIYMCVFFMSLCVNVVCVYSYAYLYVCRPERPPSYPEGEAQSRPVTWFPSHQLHPSLRYTYTHKDT